MTTVSSSESTGRDFSPMRLAAYCVAAAGLLHVVGGLASGGLQLAIFGVVYLLFAAGLWRGMRWLAYFVFLFMLFGAIVAYALTGGAGPVPSAVYTAIALADFAAALLLFLALWRTA